MTTTDARTIEERFTDGLDETVWTAAYLPAWSSRAASAATWDVQADGLHLTIPPGQALWCPDLHDGALRVSAVQSGNWSGPVGTTLGQQPFIDGQKVTEEQPAQWGFTPQFGHVEVTCRAEIAPGSMFSAWMVGLEDQPDRCGEICVMEVFGNTIVRDGDHVSSALGCGIHEFRDPALSEDFSADPRPLDVARFHRYAVDWQPDRVDFFVDGALVRSSPHAPSYPMQLILGVFDFPDESHTEDSSFVPQLVVSSVVGHPL